MWVGECGWVSVSGVWHASMKELFQHTNGGAKSHLSKRPLSD